MEFGWQVAQLKNLGCPQNPQQEEDEKTMQKAVQEACSGSASTPRGCWVICSSITLPLHQKKTVDSGVSETLPSLGKKVTDENLGMLRGYPTICGWPNWWTPKYSPYAHEKKILGLTTQFILLRSQHFKLRVDQLALPETMPFSPDLVNKPLPVTPFSLRAVIATPYFRWWGRGRLWVLWEKGGP